MSAVDSHWVILIGRSNHRRCRAEARPLPCRVHPRARLHTTRNATTFIYYSHCYAWACVNTHVIKPDTTDEPLQPRTHEHEEHDAIRFDARACAGKRRAVDVQDRIPPPARRVAARCVTVARCGRHDADDGPSGSETF